MCYASPRNVTAKRSENDGVAKCCSNVRVVSDVRRGEAFKAYKKVFYFVYNFKEPKLLMENQIFFLKEDDRWWKATQRYQPLFIFFSNLLFNSNSKWIIGVQTFKK